MVGREARLLETVDDERSYFVVVFYDQHSHFDSSIWMNSLIWQTVNFRRYSFLGLRAGRLNARAWVQLNVGVKCHRRESVVSQQRGLPLLIAPPVHRYRSLHC